MAKQTFIERVLTRERKPGKGGRHRLVVEAALASLSHVPPTTHVHPWLKADSTDMRWLPINEDLEIPPSAPAPLDLLERLIEEASHRVIYKACGCRTAGDCKNHPLDIGCLLMGDQAIESPRSVSREVGRSEAKEHMHRAVEAGLVPMVGKARVDNYIFGIKDHRRMMTCCFCCDCCCITRVERFFPVKHLEQMFPRLDGARIEVTSECDGCPDGKAECFERCYIKAIRLDGEGRSRRALVTDRCRACGRCALACPRDAISVKIEEDAFLEKSYERILAHVNHT